MPTCSEWWSIGITLQASWLLWKRVVTSQGQHSYTLLISRDPRTGDIVPSLMYLHSFHAVPCPSLALDCPGAGHLCLQGDQPHGTASENTPLEGRCSCPGSIPDAPAATQAGQGPCCLEAGIMAAGRPLELCPAMRWPMAAAATRVSHSLGSMGPGPGLSMKANDEPVHGRWVSSGVASFQCVPQRLARPPEGLDPG